MANWLYTKFVENQLIDTAAVDFDADVIKGALYRSSSYTPNQSTDEYLSDAGNPISTAFITVSVSGAVVDADDFTFGSVAAGAAIDVLVLYKDTGSAATSPLIAKYDINVTPDGNDITISVNNAGLFTLGDALGLIGISNGGTGQGSKTAAFDALAPSTTKGDLIVHDGADNVRLAKGTDGHVLKANSAAATGLEWGTVVASPLTTKGDLYTFDTDDARLAKGADGTFLRANSATGTGLEWGAISAGDVPNLSADKITSGTLDGARIPSLDASKITSGTFNDAQIPNLAAGKITSGTFDAARIPSLDASKITSGSVAIAQGGTGQTTAVAAFDALAPSTSKGDLIAHDGTDNVRVGVGANNTVLLADSAVASGVKWSSVPAASVSAGTFGAGNYKIDGAVTIDGAANAVQLRIQANNTQTQNLQTWETAAASVLTRINDAGYLGIGAVPSYPLHVEATTTGGMYVSTSLTTTSGIAAIFETSHTKNANPLVSYRNKGNVVSQLNHNGLQFWYYYNASDVGIGSIQYSTPDGAPGIIFFTGALFNENRFNFANKGTYFNFGFDADGRATAGLNVYAGGNTVIGTAIAENARLLVRGSSNIVQLLVRGNATQTANVLVCQDSTSAVIAAITPNGGLIVNEQGRDADTRIEGDTDANLLFVDASADSVQIGSATTADSAKFYVLGKISGSGEFEINGDLNHDGSNVGFYGTAPAAKGTVTGSRGGNAALASLLTALVNIGLITDSSTA